MQHIIQAGMHTAWHGHKGAQSWLVLMTAERGKVEIWDLGITARGQGLPVSCMPRSQADVS